jgi:hypothetical protein
MTEVPTFEYETIMATEKVDLLSGESTVSIRWVIVEGSDPLVVLDVLGRHWSITRISFGATAGKRYVHLGGLPVSKTNNKVISVDNLIPEVVMVESIEKALDGVKVMVTPVKTKSLGTINHRDIHD